MAGIYIHIPFCKQACHYCDFHFSTSSGLKAAMLQAILKEIKIQSAYLQGHTVNSIYFGGGTPSLFEASALSNMLTTIDSAFALAKSLEITLEANPDDLNLNKLQAYKTIGINRLSIGIQSFHDVLLRYLNRAHNSEQAINSIALARQAGLDNLSIDLIYGIPIANHNKWVQDLATTVALAPDHISAYGLTIEKNTVFGRWHQQGQLKLTDEAVIAKQFDTLVAVLSKHGYAHYEISNFSKPHRYSRHNINYWQQGHYLGIGPSAHSYNKKTRQYNIAHNPQYIKSINKGVVPCKVEFLSKKDHINEYILTTLRTKCGCDLAWLKQNYDYDLWEIQKAYFNELINRRLIDLKNNILLLTQSGQLLADKITADLFII